MPGEDSNESFRRRPPSYDPTGRTTSNTGSIPSSPHRPSTADTNLSKTFPPPSGDSAVDRERPSTATAYSQRHKRLWAHDVAKTRAPGWSTHRPSTAEALSPRGGSAGVPSTYRPMSSDRYGNLEESTGNPTVRSELVSRPSSGRTPRPPASDMATRGSVTSSEMELKQATMHFRPTLPYQVTWDADQERDLVRHVGVQCASTSWTRFFHGIGQSTNISLKKGNPFYQHFDVYLDPDPLGPIHVLGKDSDARLAASLDDPIGGKVTREEFTDFFRRSHERLYFVTGTQPEDLFVDIHHLGTDATEAWPSMGKARQHERLNLIEYTRYVRRLQPRSGDDMKQLMRLQSGLLRHMTDEIANSEREVAERVRSIEAKLKTGFNEKADRLEAALAAERAKNATLQRTLDSSQKAINSLEAELAELKESSSKTIADLTAALEKAREQLAESLKSEDRLRLTLDEVKTKAETDVFKLKEEIEILTRKLRASEVKNTKLEMQLNGLKVEYDAAKEDLGRAAGVSLIARQGDLPSMECYLPVASAIGAVSIPSGSMTEMVMVDVTVPADTSLQLPPGMPGVEGLESGDGKVLAKRLPESAGQDNSKLSKGQVMRQIPCGTHMKLPPGFSDEDSFEDEGAFASLPAGSVVVVPVTLKTLDDSSARAAAEEDAPLAAAMDVAEAANAESGAEAPAATAASGDAVAIQAGSGLAAAKALQINRYRLRKVNVPGGSIVTLPRFVHEGVNRYTMRAQSSCVVMVSSLEVAAGRSLLDEADTPEEARTLLDASTLAGRFSEKPDARGTVKLDLKPGTIIVTTEPDGLSELLVPEGSTIVLGAGGSAIYKPESQASQGPSLKRMETFCRGCMRLAELESQLFPLELLRMRVKVLLERQESKAEQGDISAASTAVLCELLKTEPRRMKGQVYALDDESKAPIGGLISIDKTRYSATESSGEVVVTLKRKGGGEGRAGVIVSTVDGGAMADSDYKPLKDLEVIWEDGDVEDRSVSIELIDDDFHEGDEQFYFVITDPHPECAGTFAMGMNDACSILIIDDDNPDELSAGMPLSWANVTTDGKMPWDATGFPRQLSIPEPLASKAWKGSAQKAEKSMKPERLKALSRNFIQAKRNADLIDDRNGSVRDGYPQFYKFFMEYNFGAQRAPGKSAALLRSMRHIYRQQSDPFICMVVSLVGWYDPAPSAFGNLFTKMVSLMSNDLVSCDHSPNKFWARLGLELKMSVKEVKVIVSDMFRGNDGAAAPFKLTNLAEEIQAVVGSGQAIAEEGADSHITEAEIKVMTPDEVPRIPVVKFIILLMQHLIVRLRKFRPALGQILDDHSEKSEDADYTAMMTWEKFEQAWTVINPKFNAKSRAALYNMVCQKQINGDGAKKARKSDAALKAPRKSQHGPTGGSKGTDSKEKIAVRKDLVEQVICSEVDFLFCSSWT